MKKILISMVGGAVGFLVIFGYVQAQPQPAGPRILGVPSVSSLALSSNAIYNMIITYGGQSNAIVNLNGKGTNTVLYGGTGANDGVLALSIAGSGQITLGTGSPLRAVGGFTVDVGAAYGMDTLGDVVLHNVIVAHDITLQDITSSVLVTDENGLVVPANLVNLTYNPATQTLTASGGSGIPVTAESDKSIILSKAGDVLMYTDNTKSNIVMRSSPDSSKTAGFYTANDNEFFISGGLTIINGGAVITGAQTNSAEIVAQRFIASTDLVGPAATITANGVSTSIRSNAIYTKNIIGTAASGPNIPNISDELTVSNATHGTSLHSRSNGVLYISELRATNGIATTITHNSTGVIPLGGVLYSNFSGNITLGLLSAAPPSGFEKSWVFMGTNSAASASTVTFPVSFLLATNSFTTTNVVTVPAGGMVRVAGIAGEFLDTNGAAIKWEKR